MSKEELVQFLKDNLNVNVWCNHNKYGERQINVSINLDDNVISQCSDCLY